MAGKSKYWEKPITQQPSYRPWLDWNSEDTAPKDGAFIFARLKNSAITRAVRWLDGCWQDAQGRQVEIWQWKSYKEFRCNQECIWRNGP